MKRNHYVATGKSLPKAGTPDFHQHKIAVDTVKNPAKGLMGGPSAQDAEEVLRAKFKYTNDEIKKLKGESRGSFLKAITSRYLTGVENKVVSKASGKNLLTAGSKVDIPFEQYAAKGSEFEKEFTRLVDANMMNTEVEKAYGKKVTSSEMDKEIKLAWNTHSKWGRQKGSSPLHLGMAMAMANLLAALRTDVKDLKQAKASVAGKDPDLYLSKYTNNEKAYGKKVTSKASGKKLDDEIAALYKKHGDGVQINMMDIMKIYKDCRDAAAAGTSLEEAMIAAIAKYRLN